MALLIALLWTAHPLQTQAVTYLSQRLESLSGLCVLTATYCAFRGAAAAERGPKQGGPAAKIWKSLAVLACLAAVLSKESGAVAPFLVLGGEITLRRRRVREALAASPYMYAGFGVCLAVLANVLVSGGQWGSGPGNSRFSHAGYLLTQAEALLRYLRLVIWPVGQSLDYGWPPSRFPQVLPELAAVMCLLAATGWALWRRLPAAYVGLWFFVTLAPTSLMLLPDAVVEYRMYLALAGVVALLVLTGAAFLAQRGRRWLQCGAGLGILAVLVLGFLTYERNKDYAGSVSIWLDTAHKSTRNQRAWANLAEAFLGAGRPSEALVALGAATALGPATLEMLRNQGEALLRLGRPSEAIPYFEAALRTPAVGDLTTSTWLKLSVAHFQVGHQAMGERCLAYALARQDAKRNMETLALAAMAAAAAGKMELAVGLFQTIWAADPENVGKKSNVAVALHHMGRTTEARRIFEEIVLQEPAHSVATKYLRLPE